MLLIAESLFMQNCIGLFDTIAPSVVHFPNPAIQISRVQSYILDYIDKLINHIYFRVNHSLLQQKCHLQLHLPNYACYLSSHLFNLSLEKFQDTHELELHVLSNNQTKTHSIPNAHPQIHTILKPLNVVVSSTHYANLSTKRKEECLPTSPLSKPLHPPYLNNRILHRKLPLFSLNKSHLHLARGAMLNNSKFFTPNPGPLDFQAYK